MLMGLFSEFGLGRGLRKFVGLILVRGIREFFLFLLLFLFLSPFLSSISSCILVASDTTDLQSSGRFLWKAESASSNPSSNSNSNQAPTAGGGEMIRVKTFKWTGKNDYVALCSDEAVSFGGG
jgi:hypothetical protein